MKAEFAHLQSQLNEFSEVIKENIDQISAFANKVSAAPPAPDPILREKFLIILKTRIVFMSSLLNPE